MKMTWTKARGGVYAVGTAGAVSAVAIIFAGMGWIEYDPVTRIITIPPFSVDALVALIPTAVTLLSAPLAWIAVLLGLGGKK